jgi:lysophospholipase L1-like esterase
LKEAGRIVLVHMGDSITFGQHIDPDVRWTSLIASRLAASYEGSGVELVSINSGVSGDTTRMGLERFPAAVQAHRPDVVTIQFGLNDCNCWQTDAGIPRVTEAAYEANLLEMIARSRRFGARQVILATNHPTLRRGEMVSGEVYEEANARYSEIARGVAVAAAVTLCDIRFAFAGLSDAELADLLLPMPDVLHLSEAGNRLYADAIWPIIQTAVGTIAKPPARIS